MVSVAAQWYHQVSAAVWKSTHRFVCRSMCWCLRWHGPLCLQKNQSLVVSSSDGFLIRSQQNPGHQSKIKPAQYWESVIRIVLYYSYVLMRYTNFYLRSDCSRTRKLGQRHTPYTYAHRLHQLLLLRRQRVGLTSAIVLNARLNTRPSLLIVLTRRDCDQSELKP